MQRYDISHLILLSAGSSDIGQPGPQFRSETVLLSFTSARLVIQRMHGSAVRMLACSSGPVGRTPGRVRGELLFQPCRVARSELQSRNANCHCFRLHCERSQTGDPASEPQGTRSNTEGVRSSSKIVKNGLLPSFAAKDAVWCGE